MKWDVSQKLKNVRCWATALAAFIFLFAIASWGMPSTAHDQSVSTPPPLPALPSPPPPTPYAFPSPSPSPTPTPKESLTPDQILERTEEALRGNPDPPYITYKMHEIFVHHGKTHEYDYQVWYRSDGKGLMQNLAPGRRGKNETFFGYPFPSAPDNNILLYATPPPQTTPPPPIGTSATGSAAPVISHEHVTGDRYYIVSYDGLENYRGKTVYHLALRAVKDEQKHPWTDLWVDIDSFQVWKAHGDASGSSGPLTGRAVVDVEFAPIGNYWLVKQAAADGEGRLGPISDSGHYEYYFSDFGFPNTLPDWYFNEADFDRHRP
ncbi:MAG: hypothetical protein JOZ91_05510 [Candidatus Eremiobacteraeota bacterium]|nr:hypothetical protein [Candidatus Eremiobacteraeota bacterium]MBV8595522.1 hypothetical protein [Candidatus Eremiobacteraeota bacterium]MBV8668253.1 hypothetical protein [Candidatus Eremiobacteraeota bacterium]